ncbi:MAG: hypothetical protein ACO1SV_19105 [Fimbriimonas sp.]
MILSALLVLTSAKAQLGPITHPTLEALISGADHAFRGSVVACKRVETVPPNGKRDNTTWPDGWAEVTLTIRVDEAWKGRPGRTVTLTRETNAYDRRYGEWAKHRASFVWLVRNGKGADWTAIRIGAPVPADRGYATDSYPLLSNDLRLLRNEADVLRVARRFAKRSRETWPLQKVPMPGALYAPSLRAGLRISPDGNDILVCVTPDMVDTAFDLIKKPDRWAEKDRNAQESFRRVGIEILKASRSKPVVDRVRRLLKDETSFWENGKRSMPVAEAAADILSSWGIVVDSD